MIKAIFFSRFHPERGPVVLHQVPAGSIVPSRSPDAQLPLFDFASISDFLIARQEFFDRLVTISANHHRILGHPVRIADKKYSRNEYIFNLAIVLDDQVEPHSYENLVRKLARLFHDLEEQSSLISESEGPNDVEELTSPDDSPRGLVFALCEMILEDLNNYCECMIPIENSNTLNLKVFPSYPSPAPVKPWNVPLNTIRLSILVDNNSDITLSRIIPFIDGINSVARIAKLANTDLKLTQKAVSHLRYYGCLLLLDMFHSSGMYAPSANIDEIVLDQEMQEECARYVATTSKKAEADTLLRLYLSFRLGPTIRVWSFENQSLLKGIDIRRLITFGVIKGILYRIHKYGLSTRPTGRRGHANDHAFGSTNQQILQRKHQKTSYASLQSANYDELHDLETSVSNLPLTQYFNGSYCFDEICNELQLSEKVLVSKLRGRGDVQIIYR